VAFFHAYGAGIAMLVVGAWLVYCERKERR
jgi:hypothetical protein